MFDSFVLLAPALLLVVVALLHFVGCGFSISPPVPDPIDPVPEPAIISWLRNAENDPDEVALTNQATTAAFADALQQGNLIVVWIFYESQAQTVDSVTDTANSVSSPSNIYRRAVGPTRGQGDLDQYQQEIWWAENITGDSAVTVTATFTAAFDGEKAISAHEYQNALGIDPNGSLPQVGTGADTSVGPVPVVAGGLMFAAGMFTSGATPGVGFAPLSTLANNVAQDQRFPVAGEQTAVFENDPQDHVVQVITLLPKLVLPS